MFKTLMQREREKKERGKWKREKEGGMQQGEMEKDREAERAVEEERQGGRCSKTTNVRRHLLMSKAKPLIFLNVFNGYRPIHFCN